MKTPFLNSIQSMRFFASLGVVQYHLWQNYFGIAIGHPGTDFFLVLVGIVAAYTQTKWISNCSWWGYISARYKRLYVTFTPLFIISLLAKWTEADFSWALKSFFFIPIAGRSPVIGSTWMLSMFLLFYFVFSLCFLAGIEKIIWIIFGIWSGSILAYLVFGWQPALPREWANLFFGERNFEFILGYLVGVVLRRNPLQIRHARMFLGLGLAGIIVGTIMLNTRFYSSGRALFLGLPVAVFFLGLATLEQNNSGDWIIGLLTRPWLVWLGGTSYVLYLSHSIFFQVWNLMLPVTPILAVFMTIGAIFAAALGFVFWENPVLTYLKDGKWIKPHLPELKLHPAYKGIK